MNCLCTRRTDITCNEQHCSIAGPGAPGDPNQCRICWLRLGLGGNGHASRVTPVDPPRPPGHDRAAFNCSVLDMPNGRTLFAYRCGWDGARIAACELDANHQPGPSWLLETPRRLPQDVSGQEDPRLFLSNGELFCAYIGVRSGPKGLDTHQCLMRLSPDGKRVLRSWCPHYPQRKAWEKNWAFFTHEGRLHAVYSINPHRVVRVDDNAAALMHEELGPDPAKGDKFRGGAPPVQIGNEFYHWFHGKIDRGQNSDYWIGVYTFEARPPFKPLRYCREKLLVPQRFDRPLPTVPHCVFPCGAVLRGDKWVVSYGYYDHYCRIAEFDAAKVERWLGRRAGGAGTELKRLLQSLGVGPGDCDCNTHAAEMDRQGPDWCSANIGMIVNDWLRPAYERLGWGEKIRAATKAIASGLILNPIDPLPGLVREAILRARENGR